MRAPLTATVAILAALAVHDMLPRGLFGAYDIAARAAVSATVAALTAALVLALKRGKSST